MRVISGVCKGQPLLAVPGKQTRPTTDKVKEAIFNMIGPYFTGGTCLDLFAGSGSLGIEALSRGLEKAIFIERNYQAIQTINKNLANCNLVERAEVFRNDAKRALKQLKKRGLTFDYIFLDPPYEKQLLMQVVEMIAEKALLVQGGMLVCEHEVQVGLQNKIGDLKMIRNVQYGLTSITIYTSSKN